MSRGGRKRKPGRRAAAATPTVRREPPIGRDRPRTVPPDELLPPWERGPVRGFVRDAVDARGPRPMLLFMPAFAVVLITVFGPQSELGRALMLAGLAALAVVAADAVLLGGSITQAARQAFPGQRVGRLPTTWYVFMRSHRPRSMRRPAPG